MKTLKIKVTLSPTAVIIFGLIASGVDAATSIISHSGSSDPTSQGWTSSDSNIFLDSSGVSRGPIMNDAGTGLDSWYLESDPSSDSKPSIQGSQLTYSSPNLNLPSNTNWTLSVRVRVAGTATQFDVSGQRASLLSVRYTDGSNFFGMYFDRESDGDPTVALGGFGTASPQYTLDGEGDSQYHHYELRYDSSSGTADLFVDGTEVISDYSGYSSSAPQRVSWDMNVLDESGPPNLRAHFNSVNFSAAASPLSSTVNFTGPKSGSITVEGKVGFTYRLMRKENLSEEGSIIDEQAGTGADLNFNFDDSAASAQKAFFWIEETPDS